MCTDGIILKMAEKLEKRSLKYFSSYYSLHFIKENMQIKLTLLTLEWHGAQIGSLPDATYMPLGSPYDTIKSHVKITTLLFQSHSMLSLKIKI